MTQLRIHGWTLLLVLILEAAYGHRVKFRGSTGIDQVRFILVFMDDTANLIRSRTGFSG